MTGQTRLVESVKNWLQIDTEIKQLQTEIRKRRKMKKEMTDSLVQIMKSQDIEIMNAGESQLIRTEKKTKSALSKKHLITSLLQFFKEDKEKIKYSSIFPAYMSDYQFKIYNQRHVREHPKILGMI